MFQVAALCQQDLLGKKDCITHFSKNGNASQDVYRSERGKNVLTRPSDQRCGKTCRSCHRSLSWSCRSCQCGSHQADCLNHRCGCQMNSLSSRRVHHWNRNRLHNTSTAEFRSCAIVRTKSNFSASSILRIGSRRE